MIHGGDMWVLTDYGAVGHEGRFVDDLKVSLPVGQRSAYGGDMTPEYTVKPLNESTWPAFEALIRRSGGMVAGCWCMGFHPEGVGKGTTADGNRDRKLGRVMKGEAHAALVFDGDECLGWCQFGSPQELPNIKNRAAYDKDASKAPDWRIGCCYVGKGHRRQGVATAALAGTLELIALAGGGMVEGYPEPADAVPAGFLFNGSLSTYEKLGFVKQRRIGKHRWVMAASVKPSR